MLKGLTIKGSQCFSPGEFSRALNLVRDGKINAASLVTHKFSLDDVNEAFETALRAEGGKILVEP